MPYITKMNRERINDNVKEPETAGELNYAITMLCNDFIRDQGKRYDSINAVIGVLECAKLEFYRRLAAPYEDQKIEENGDVY